MRKFSDATFTVTLPNKKKDCSYFRVRKMISKIGNEDGAIAVTGEN